MSSLKVVLILVVLPALLHLSHGLSRCDLDIIDKIKQIWDVNGQPKDILQIGNAAMQESIIETTPGYYPADTRCAFSVFGNHGATITLFVVPKQGEPKQDTKRLVEDNGVVIEPDTGIKRYYIFSENGVVAWYKCSDSVREGPPEGAIKVKSGSSYDEAAVSKAESLLSQMGLTLTDKYPSECTTFDK